MLITHHEEARYIGTAMLCYTRCHELLSSAWPSFQLVVRLFGVASPWTKHSGVPTALEQETKP